jgi:cytidylate kinase
MMRANAILRGAGVVAAALCFSLSGSAARALARRVGFLHLDTGAIYRAFTLRALRRGVNLEDEAALAARVEPEAIAMEPLPGGAGERIHLDGADVSRLSDDERILWDETVWLTWHASSPVVVTQ